MLEDYLAYGTLIISLIISVLMGYRAHKYLDHGEAVVSLFGEKIIIFLALGIWMTVALAAFVISFVLGLCGVSNQMLDYLFPPLTLAIFALAYAILKKLGKVMA